MTCGQRWRLRRDIVIALAHRGGISQRMLADVFDLPRSRIAVIVNGIENRASKLANRSDAHVLPGMFQIARRGPGKRTPGTGPAGN